MLGSKIVYALLFLPGIATAWVLRNQGGLWRTFGAMIGGFVLGAGITVGLMYALVDNEAVLSLGSIGTVLGPIAGARVAARMRAPLSIQRPMMKRR